MLLSKLVYLSVKNVIYLSDKSFTYDTFLSGDFDNDSDYAININNVFSPLNEAISRLNELDKIPYQVESVKASQIIDGMLDLSLLSKKVNSIVHIVQIYNSTYRTLPFRKRGANQVFILGYIDKSRDVYVEYKEDIPSFDYSDIQKIAIGNNSEVIENNIDLKSEYGISESASNYIMEYVQGKLSEPIAPELANLHITRSEQYMSDLESANSSFHQRVVENVYRIGD